MHALRMVTALLALVAAAYAAYGVPARSKGVPSGWIEDFNAAKAAAAKENKHILMCSITSDSLTGKRMYNEVFSQGKFTGKIKKQFILMMVDMSNDAKNLSRVALVQNIDIRRRYNIWGNGNCCVVDKNGSALKRFSIEGDVMSCWIRVEAATKDIPPPLPTKQADGESRNPSGVVQRPLANRPITSTPAPTAVRSMTPSAHLREGNRLAAAGEWNEALDHFRHSGGRLAKMAEFEAGGEVPTVKLADGWWMAMSLAQDENTRLAYQSHAAHLYRMALAEGGLPKDVAETAAQRGEERGTSLYCVIDLSGGANAASYPVSYFDDIPERGWSDEYKTRKLVLRRIDPGTFIMGEDQNDESHRVTITKPFYIGVFETTQKQWELVTGTKAARPWQEGDTRPAHTASPNMIFGESNADEPNTFIGRVRVRSGLDIGLPTEAQWEYACRAGTKSRFNNGGDSEEDMFKVGRFRSNQGKLDVPKEWTESEKAIAKARQRVDGIGNCRNGTTVVGLYLPNKWGLYDMHGNVAEICRDKNGFQVFGADPVGSTNGHDVAKRGGGWYDGIARKERDDTYIEALTSHCSGTISRDRKDWNAGFRVCASIGTMRLATSAAHPTVK